MTGAEAQVRELLTDVYTPAGIRHLAQLPQHNARQRARMPEEEPMNETKHHPSYMVARGQCWASCSCGWLTDPKVNGNQTWAQQQFARHLIEAPR